MKIFFIAFHVFILLVSISAQDLTGDIASVRFVRAVENTSGSWSFDVTVAHNDEGWDHYADWWRILDPDGNELARRVLRHPHLDEPPFTR